MVHGCLLLARHVANADAAIVVRDVDDQPERARALERLHEDAKLAPRIAAVLASPRPEIEAWLVSGFAARDGRESARLEAVCKRISFDPTAEAHRLSSKGKPPERDAKTVHDELLVDSGADRWKACLCGALDLPAVRHAGCGLQDFIADVTKTLLPVIVAGVGGDARIAEKRT
jgi:hypothetical protein